MKEGFFKVINRRDFLKKSLRTIIFSSLGFMGLALGLRKGSGDSRRFSTLPYQQCQGCSKAFECEIIQKEPDKDLKIETKDCPLAK